MRLDGRSAGLRVLAIVRHGYLRGTWNARTARRAAVYDRKRRESQCFRIMSDEHGNCAISRGTHNDGNFAAPLSGFTNDECAVIVAL